MAELSGITAKGKLVSEKQWLAHIKKLKSAVSSEIRSKDAAKKFISEKLLAAVEQRSNQKFGILFSGGVDSALIAFICRKLGRKFSCYTVGIKGSKDLQVAKVAARQLKLHLISKELSLREVEALLKKSAKILPLKDVVSMEVATVELAAISLAKAHGDDKLFTGLGAEEIFAGYQRHVEAKDANAECWSGLEKMWARDLCRDCGVASSEKVSFLVPLLDQELIALAMRIPARWKIKGSERKVILRETALEMGLPRQYAFRKKIAAQYGSSFDKAVDKLARMHGFKHKQEYVASIPK
jgi:asparagine synthetase B (glutamine-hydrolysing)